MRTLSVFASVLIASALPAEETGDKTAEWRALIAKLDSKDFETREAARKALNEVRTEALPVLIQARGTAEAPETQHALDLLITGGMLSLGRLANDNARQAAPQDLKRLETLRTEYAQWPEPVRKDFWAAVRNAEAEAGDDPPVDRRNPNILARLETVPVLEESTLELNADGSGTYRHSVELKPMLLSLAILLKEEDADTKELEKDVDKMLAEKFEEFQPPPIVKNLLKPEERKKGLYQMAFAFKDLKSLNEAIAESDLVFKPRFRISKGSDGQRLLQRELPWPGELGMVGLEFSFIDGVRERVTFKLDQPVLRCTGKRVSEREVVCEGMKWDQAAESHPAVEWGKAVERKDEFPQAARHAATDLNAGLAKALAQLAEPDRNERRIGVWTLANWSNRTAEREPSELRAVTGSLFTFAEREQDLLLQLEGLMVLSALTGRKYVLPHWAQANWRDGLPDEPEGK